MAGSFDEEMGTLGMTMVTGGGASANTNAALARLEPGGIGQESGGWAHDSLFGWASSWLVWNEAEGVRPGRRSAAGDHVK